MGEFLKFNKLKALTDNVEDIKKALGTSEMLSISPDGKGVKRTTATVKKEDADDCTIYVESLPKTATHAYMEEIFARYGPIAYVSLPRYKQSRKIKEFGFVEFENKASVEKALNAFKEFGGVLQYKDQELSNMQSVVSYNLEQKGEVEEQTEKVEEETEEEEEPLKKKLRLDESTDGELATEAKVEDESKETQKRKKKKKVAKNPTDKIFDLKIMSKREWKRLRNKYLNLQREKIKEIKQKLQAGRKKQEPKPKAVVKIKTSPRKINFYGAMQDRRSGSEDNMEEVPALKKPLFSFEPGLIVNLKFQVPCVDVKDFKAELKQFNYVKYVDVKEGELEAFVRVDKVASANQLVKFYTNSEYQVQILSGEVEQKYWSKMLDDREKKFSKSVKLKQPRGREKLAKKIAAHIRFEEE